MMNENVELARQFDEQKKNDLRQYSADADFSYEQLIELWDQGVEIQVEAPDNKMPLVFGARDKAYSLKPFNVFLNIPKLLNWIVDNIVVDAVVGEDLIPDEHAKAFKKAIKIILDVLRSSLRAITAEQAKILTYCFNKNAHQRAIPEEWILRDVAGATPEMLTELDKMQCVRINEGNVKLVEKILLSQ